MKCGYCDDVEYGTGEKILIEMKKVTMSNASIIVTCWAAANKLGSARFNTIECVAQNIIELAGQIASK